MKIYDMEITHTFAEYMNGGTAIQLWCDEGPYATATVWVPGLAADEVAIKNYSENEGVYDALYEAGIIEAAHRYVHSGFVDIPVCRLKKGGLI